MRDRYFWSFTRKIPCQASNTGNIDLGVDSACRVVSKTFRYSFGMTDKIFEKIPYHRRNARNIKFSKFYHQYHSQHDSAIKFCVKSQIPGISNFQIPPLSRGQSFIWNLGGPIPAIKYWLVDNLKFVASQRRKFGHMITFFFPICHACSFCNLFVVGRRALQFFPQTYPVHCQHLIPFYGQKQVPLTLRGSGKYRFAPLLQL